MLRSATYILCFCLVEPSISGSYFCLVVRAERFSSTSVRTSGFNPLLGGKQIKKKAIDGGLACMDLIILFVGLDVVATVCFYAQVAYTRVKCVLAFRFLVLSVWIDKLELQCPTGPWRRSELEHALGSW